MARHRILGVFAHPDDEVFCAGGTLAKSAAQGAETIVLCATRGQAGQIREATAATRATLPEVREMELRAACDCLGVSTVRLLDHVDGTLAELDRQLLEREVLEAIDELDPEVVITFGPDGAYGHPDHVTIGEVTTAACRERPEVRLFHSYFARTRMLLVERVAEWLVALQHRFKGEADFARVFSLFAQETNALGYADDHLDIAWFPSGTAIVEQGETADALYLILSGEVEVSSDDGDERHVLRRCGPGEFFGEIGVASRSARTAHVVAVESVTCLAFRRRATDLWAARGAGTSDDTSAHGPDVGPGMAGATAIVDVRSVVDRKIAAVAAHRTQYPIDPELFPRWMLEEMMGFEHFVQVQPPILPATTLFA